MKSWIAAIVFFEDLISFQHYDLNNKLREKGKLKIFEDDDSKIKITKFNIKYWDGNSR